MLADRTPKSLHALPRWVVWRREEGRKQPFAVRTGRAAEWNAAPATFAEAIEAMSRPLTFKGRTAKPDGVGFILGGHLAGLDLDAALFTTPEGKLTVRAWARPILDAARAAGCWIEASPSKTGLHIVGTADGSEPAPQRTKTKMRHGEDEPAPASEKESQLEMYGAGASQYLTTTGSNLGVPVPAEPGPIAKAWAAALEAIAAHGIAPSASAQAAKADGVSTQVVPKLNPAPAQPSTPGRMQTRGGFGGPLDLLNAIAMEERAMAVWVPSAFPSAFREPSGAWKVEPENLGRNGRNRLGFKPGEGIHDFGAKDDARDGRRSPVDVFLHYADFVAPDFGGARTPDEAALKLIAAMGDDYGWLRPLFRAGRAVADVAFAEIRNVLNERDSAMAGVEWPSGTLPEALETHVRHIARRRRGAESAGLFAATVAMIASTPKAVTFDLLGDGSFVTKASLYAMLVGRSGITKSPMWRWALAPAEDAEREWAGQHRAATASFEFAKAAADSSNKRKAKKPVELAPVSDADVFAPVDENDEVANPGGIEEPKRRQRLAGATTMEALTGLLAEADEGTFIYSDELIGLLGGLDKYSKGRAGSADSAVLLECYDGGAVRVDRVSRRVRVDHSHLSIAGCATPAVLAPLLGNLGSDGLLQRFIVCPIADQHYERDQSPLNQEAEARYARAVRLILDAGQTHGKKMLLPDLEAIRAWREFDDWLASGAMAAACSEAERGWLSKAAETAGRIALGLAVIDWSWARAGGEDAPFPKTVTGATMARATRWLRQFAIPGVRTVYSAADTAGRHDDAKAIARFILELRAEGTERLTARMVYKRMSAFRGRENAHRLAAALDVLESAGWLRAENDKGETHLINPRVADCADFRNS